MENPSSQRQRIGYSFQTCTVLLSHGYPDYTAVWRRLREELAAANPGGIELSYVASGFLYHVVGLKKYESSNLSFLDFFSEKPIFLYLN